MASEMSSLISNVRTSLNILFTPVLYYGVVASIALQLSTWEKGDRTQDKYQDQYQNQGDRFDFIIVGGGTGGSILANRLSQHYNVLLLEGGGEPNPLQFVPGLSRNILHHPQVDWMHMTVAQKKSCAFSKFRRASWPSGKGLGGSGSLDFMHYLRGNPEDFDNWAKITKDPSWKYDHVLKHFQRGEDLVGNSTDPSAHRHGGELRIQKGDYAPLAKEFLSAAKELGYQNVDLNGHFQEGFDYVYSTIKRGERQAPVKAFLDPIRKRKTLTIRKFAFVSKVKFLPDNTAYGVEYERHGEKYSAYANREIILSAGSIGSPKVLMLSGVGPKRHLEELGIKTIVNLPVGQNLQDHVGTYLGPFFINEALTLQKDKDITAQSYVEYGTQGTGPLTFAGFSANGFISSLYSKGRGEANWPDLHLSLFPQSVDKGFISDLAHTHGLNPDNLKKYYNHAIGKHSFHIFTSIARPAGRGEIRLASRNPQDPLVINPKYLEDPWDLDVKAAVDGIKTALRLVEGSTTFQNIGGRFTSEIVPGCESTKFRSDQFWECYLRHYTVSLYNPVGTCAMGPRDSIFAVVDPKLRVIGVKGLRVVDASVMPAITSGGTSGPTMMIAEKAAEIILSYWSHRAPRPDLEDDQKVDLKIKHVPKAPLESFSKTQVPSFIGDSNTADSSVVPKVIKPENSIIKSIENLSMLAKNFSSMISPSPSPNSFNVNNILKPVSPFSVSIKTSSPTSVPKPLGSSSTTVTTTMRPLMSLLSFLSSSTTSTPPSGPTMKPFTVTAIPKAPVNNPTNQPQAHVQTTPTPSFIVPSSFSFPIVPNSSQSTSPTNKPLIKLRRQPVKKITDSSTMGPLRNSINELLEPYFSTSTTTTPAPQKSSSTHQYKFRFYEEQPTPRPQETFSTSTYSIQPAKEIDFHPSLLQDVPTTYRPPEIVLMNPHSKEMITPKDHLLLPTQEDHGLSSNPFEQPQILYIVTENQNPQSNIPIHQYHPIVANSQRYKAPSQYYQPPPPSPSTQPHHDAIPFHFNFQDETDPDEYYDRFTRAQQYPRYLEKPIKVHTHKHPTKVVRRIPKAQLSQTQAQIQQNIMSQLRRFIPQRSKQKVDIQPAPLVYHGEGTSPSNKDPSVEGSNLVIGTRIFNAIKEHQARQAQRRAAEQRNG